MKVEPSQRYLESVSHDFARVHLVISNGMTPDGAECLLVGAHTAPEVPFNVGVRLGVDVTVSLEDEAELAAAIDEVYGRAREGTVEAIATESRAWGEKSVSDLLADAQGDLLATDGKGRVAQLVDSLLFEAVRRRASDVHVQATASGAQVRCRVDGVLQPMHPLPREVGQVVVSRVKVMAGLDVAERKLAQDGRAQVRIGEQVVDLRVSTFPTRHGERTVLRLLARDERLTNLVELGLPARHHAALAGASLQGMTLVTGPTGAGKTTTLYAVLRELSDPSLNLMTIEDPIEYELSNFGIDVSQAQVNERKGVTFANGLRHMLRQDPDVIMVGEIRDGETARMAVQAALTGHRVLSTLHTNDAPSAVARLQDLGVEPFLLGPALQTVVAQRLVRRVHAACGGRGCEECLGAGFLGRIGIFEVLRITPTVRDLVSAGANADEIREAGRREGLVPLLDAGRALVEAGVTTMGELARWADGGEL